MAPLGNDTLHEVIRYAVSLAFSEHRIGGFPGALELIADRVVPAVNDYIKMHIRDLAEDEIDEAYNRGQLSMYEY